MLDSLLVGCVVLLAAVYLVRRQVRVAKGKQSACGGCSGCDCTGSEGGIAIKELSDSAEERPGACTGCSL